MKAAREGNRRNCGETLANLAGGVPARWISAFATVAAP